MPPPPAAFSAWRTSLPWNRRALSARASRSWPSGRIDMRRTSLPYTTGCLGSASPALATSSRCSLSRGLRDTPNIIPPQKLNVVNAFASRSSR